MKTIFRLLCGWMAIALAACTGDELQQIEPLQKPVAQKTISVKAYTPSEQAATRLAFEDKGEDGLKLSWTAGDAFTAVIGEERVTFTYDTENGEFTADVNENFELSNGTIAYYPAYDGENFEKDFSRQTGKLNSATTYMEGEYNGDAFSFKHSTAILKASFSGLPQNAVISSIQISGAVDITIANYNSSAAAYINLPAIANGGKLTFDVRTSDGTLYTATKTVTAEKGIETGVYYNTTVALSPAPVCNLPTGDEFKSAVKTFLQSNSSLTKIKFIAKSPATTKSDANDENATEDYSYRLVAGSDNETLEIHTSAAEFVFNENCSFMFAYLSTITAIDFNNSVNTSKVTDMSSMFSYCETLTSLDLNNFNTAKVMDMANMFNNCSALSSLDLSSFNTEKVINMFFMFQDCSSLESLNVSSFNTANVVNMDDMFNSCYALTSLDLSNFNTANVVQMSNMFYSCSSLTSLDLSSFNTANVIFMDDMFNSCYALTSLDLSNFNTAKVTSMASMFSYCFNISELDLSSFDFKENVILTEMFTNLGLYATNRPIPVYVKDANDIDKLDNPNTGIPGYAIVQVKQP